MTPAEIANYRLLNQQLLGTDITSAPEMVRLFSAIQGQEYAPTKWSIGLRLPKINDAEIELDFTAGKILRTHLLRPTWHLVSNADIRSLLALTAPRVHSANAFMYRNFELDEKTFNPAIDIIVRSLQGGKHLTREEINLELEKHKISASGPRLGYIMMYAELEGIICSGARKGNQFTYALLDERVENSNTVDLEEVLSGLTVSYFKSRGPATVKDFATWSGLTLSQCRKGIAMNEAVLERKSVGGEAYYFQEAALPDEKQLNNILLLPIYDELIMGYKDRSVFFQYKAGLKTPANLLYVGMIIWAGQVIGTWRRTLKQKAIQVEADFFTPLNKNQSKAFDNALNRLSDFSAVSVNYLK